jgi:hypothetical protein
MSNGKHARNNQYETFDRIHIDHRPINIALFQKRIWTVREESDQYLDQSNNLTAETDKGPFTSSMNVLNNQTVGGMKKNSM